MTTPPKTPMELSKERFEAWARAGGLGEHHFRGWYNDNGTWGYEFERIQLRWNAWEASRQAAERDALERAAKWLENAEKDYGGHFVLDAKSIIAWIRNLANG